MPDTPGPSDQPPRGPGDVSPAGSPRETPVAGPGTLVSVVGMAGGVGASTLAINLAVELSDITKDRVALVDLESRYGQIAGMLDIRPEGDIKGLSGTPTQCDLPSLEKLMMQHESGVRVLARVPQGDGAGSALPGPCVEVLRCLKQGYRYLVTDGPPRYDPASGASLALADIVVLLLRPVVTSMWNIHRILDELGKCGPSHGQQLILCNCTPPDDVLDQAMVEKAIGRRIGYAIPYDLKSVAAAIHIGIPLMKAAPVSSVRRAIRAVAADIALGFLPGPGSQKRPPDTGPSPACTMAPLIKPPGGLSARADRPPESPR